MTALDDPYVQRHRLGTALRKAREDARLTQRETAGTLSWSLSKLIRIEKGAQGLSVTDLRALVDLYGVTDKRLAARLETAARGSRGQPWWNGYRDIVSPQFAQYLAHESMASSFQVFHPLVVPGLLHTEEYAAELLGVHPAESERVRRIVELRMVRQQRLLSRPDLSFMFIVNEEVLHRPIGGPDVMRRQLQHLHGMAGKSHISLHIVPFGAGAHPGLRGPFIMLSLHETSEDILFLESAGGDRLTRDDPEQIAIYAEHFETLRAISLPVAQGNALLAELTETHGSGQA